MCNYTSSATASADLYLYEVLGPGREDLSGQWSVWCSRLLNLPMQIFHYKHNNNITILHSSRRLTNERNINTLINDLVNADWKEMYDSDDINCMYSGTSP